MEKIRLGRTDLMVSRLGFGGAPLERAPEDEAVAIVKKCVELGITFFDTAAEYHSEHLISRGIAGHREKLVISSKCECKDAAYVEECLAQSLEHFGGYLDLYFFHDISDTDTWRKASDPSGPLSVLQEAKQAGQIKHLAVSSHSVEIAKTAIESGTFDTVMCALNFVYTRSAEEVLPLTRQHDVGFIAMKPLGAGWLVNLPVAFKFLAQYPDIAAVVGLEKAGEIEEIMQVLNGSMEMTPEEQAEMMRMRAEEGSKEVFYLK